MTRITHAAAARDATGLACVALVGVARTVVGAALWLQLIAVSAARPADRASALAAAFIALPLGFPGGGVVADIVVDVVVVDIV